MRTSDEIYPLLVERKLSRRLWGGRRLSGYLQLPELGPGEPLAEAWQVAAECRILNGNLANLTLGEAAARLGEDLVGAASLRRYGTTFPLLAKFIDAAEPLSIQVHPDDAYAREVERDTGHLGKAEAWLILESLPGAHVIRGFRKAVDPAALRRAVEDDTLEDLLERQPVAPGDVIYNPPGTVHAIGGGIMLFEIQQASDLTYRLYDYGRRDSEGRLRELHVDKALDVAQLEPAAPTRTLSRELAPGRRLIFECEYFLMEELQPQQATSGMTSRTEPSSLEILTCVSGKVAISWRGERFPLPAGSSLTLPARLGDYLVEGAGSLIRCRLPDR